MIDISNSDELAQYLLEKNIVNRNFKSHTCKGGVSGTVVLVQNDNSYYIVKQALPKLKVKEDWECDPIRNRIEFKCNEYFFQMVPNHTLKPLYYDQENEIFIRKAVSDEARSWKADLLKSKIDFNVAKVYVDTLLKIHSSSVNNKQVRRDFYNKDVFYSLRVSPYIEFVVGKYPELKEKANIVIDFLMNREITLVHGDYSPKNIIIDEDENIYIIDFEVAHFGNPAFDLAFMTNHFLLKAVYLREQSLSFINLFLYSLDRYFNGMDYMDKNELTTMFSRTLGFLFLARVDGKSPAEYITKEDDKNLIRSVSEKMILNDIVDYYDIAQLLLDHLYVNKKVRLL